MWSFACGSEVARFYERIMLEAKKHKQEIECAAALVAADAELVRPMVSSQTR